MRLITGVRRPTFVPRHRRLCFQTDVRLAPTGISIPCIADTSGNLRHGSFIKLRHRSEVEYKAKQKLTVESKGLFLIS